MFIKKHYFILIASILSAFNVYYVKSIYNIEHSYQKIILYTITLVSLIMIYLVLIKLKNLKIEHKFLIIFGFFATLYLFIIPFGHNLDEETHYMRATEIANGRLISKENEKTKIVGRFDSVSLVEDLQFENYKDYYKKYNKPPKQEERFYGYTAGALYPFIVYIPNAIGIFIAKIFSNSTLIMLYMGRITGCISFMTLAYLGIKIIPKYKKFALCILLFPMTIQLSTAISGDSFTLGVSFLFIAMIMRVYNDNEITRKYLITLPVLALFVSLAKIVYFPIMFLLLLIPTNGFKNIKQKLLYITTTIIICVILNFLWLDFSMSSYLVAHSREGVNGPKQVEFVLNNLPTYIGYFFNTLAQKWSFYIESLIQADLLNPVPKPPIYAYLTFVMMLLSLVFTKDNIKLKMKNNLLVLFLFVTSVGLIFTSLYVQWSEYKSPIIEGVQGRYFLPILLMIPLLFPLKRFNKDFIQTKVIITVLTLVNSLCIINNVSIIFRKIKLY